MNTEKTFSSKVTRFSLMGLSTALVAIAALLSGCNEKETPQAVSNDAAALTQEVKTEAKKAANEVKEAAGDVKDAAVDAKDKVETEADKAADAVKDAAR